jgi:6-methylsalicylate decarboxylase
VVWPYQHGGPMKIDVHQHVWPADYVRWLHEQGVGCAPPEWTARRALAAMDRHGIGTAVLSVPWPGVHLGDADQAAAWARRVNEAAAECVRDHPARFGFFATLTLPDVNTALEEAAYALDELHADGVVLLAHPSPASPGFTPLLAELDRRRAVVFVHPAEPAVPDGLLGLTRVAFDLVRSDVPRRFPGIRFLLAHGGGVLPCVAHRLALESRRGLDEFRHFYLDTALCGASACLREFARPDHVLHGTCWPHASDDVIEHLGGRLGHDVGRGNAEKLLPRLGG